MPGSTKVAVTAKMRELAGLVRASQAKAVFGGNRALEEDVRAVLEHEAYTVSFETLHDLRGVALQHGLCKPGQLPLHELMQGTHVVKESPQAPQPVSPPRECDV